MAIYIANCSKQHLRLILRQPETGRSVMIEIPSGRQHPLMDDWTVTHQDYIISELERFKAVPASQVNRKMVDFDGTVYSTTKPISETQIISAHEAVVDHQERRSAKEATRSALAFDQTTRSKQGKRLASVTEVEVIEDTDPKEKKSKKRMSMKVSVDPKGQEKADLPL